MPGWLGVVLVVIGTIITLIAGWTKILRPVLNGFAAAEKLLPHDVVWRPASNARIAPV